MASELEDHQANYGDDMLNGVIYATQNKESMQEIAASHHITVDELKRIYTWMATSCLTNGRFHIDSPWTREGRRMNREFNNVWCKKQV
jgi:hypothetical protein